MRLTQTAQADNSQLRAWLVQLVELKGRVGGDAGTQQRGRSTHVQAGGDLDGIVAGEDVVGGVACRGGGLLFLP